jgi:antitoxin component of MazEF toxin-antitoxin module
MFDSKFLDRTNLKPGDLINVEVHSTGAITLTPMHKNIAQLKIDEVAESLSENDSETLGKLNE